ncbi:MAG: molecular chaperone HtpG [Rhodospirillaceae bacterium]|nr:molecular chaperone HtpG [Rhodospirillaceae bacterium]
MTEEKLSFQAEVSRLLDIVAKSLYSHEEVFLRELISNASDACDRLRYEALTRTELASDAPYRIVIAVDKDARTLSITDNGIGMNRQDMIDNLGTIARSGTLSAMEALTGDAKKDLALIGQFGVGFYSAFVVADRVEVLSRKAGEEQGWHWVSDGKGSFTVGESDEAPRGTTVRLHMTEGKDEFLQPHRIRHIVKTYSDHIALPIVMADDKGEEETLNRASALWVRPKSEISEDDYKEFYHHVGHAFDDPWLTIHYKAEGVMEYSVLVYVPSTQPFDLFQPERRHHVKLYVRRVFVTDEAEGLLPPYLRFLRGVVDSEDLPLNISREMLQRNPLLAKIRQAMTKRVLAEITRKADEDPGAYGTFWDSFGPLLKEGVYEDVEQRETLLGLLRFRSTTADGLTTLDDYIGRMKEGQDAIYYITGEDADAVKKSPQLEGFRAKGVEVLLLTDPVDEFWVPAVATVKDKPLKSVTRVGADLSKVKAADAEGDDKAEDKPAAPDVGPLLAALKVALEAEVKDVRASELLTESPVCLVADEHDMDMHLERLLKQHSQLQGGASKRILEINPRHPLIIALAGMAGGSDGDKAQLHELAYLMLDQARIVEGDPVPDPAAFSRRLSNAVQRGLALAG